MKLVNGGVKEESSGLKRSQTIGTNLGPWWSMFICQLMLSSSCIESISVSAKLSQMIMHFLTQLFMFGSISDHIVRKILPEPWLQFSTWPAVKFRLVTRRLPCLTNRRSTHTRSHEGDRSHPGRPVRQPDRRQVLGDHQRRARDRSHRQLPG